MCGGQCPLECDLALFNLYTSFADYPSELYAGSLMNNPVILKKFAANPSKLTYDTLKQNLVQLSIFYGDLGYEQYDEIEAMSWMDLISNIGGTLGLFIGMSFLSFVEIVDIVLQIILNRNSSNSVSPS